MEVGRKDRASPLRSSPAKRGGRLTPIIKSLARLEGHDQLSFLVRKNSEIAVNASVLSTVIYIVSAVQAAGVPARPSAAAGGPSHRPLSAAGYPFPAGSKLILPSKDNQQS